MVRLKFLHVSKYQIEVQIDRGNWETGYISSKEASIQMIPKKDGRKYLRIRGLILQKGCNNWSFIFAIQSKIKIKNVAKQGRQHARIQQRLSFTEGCLPLQAVFHQRSSSNKGHVSLKVIFPPKVVFQRGLTSNKGHLPLKVIFHLP